MSWIGFWVLVHVLLLAYWLGTDLAVFYSSRYVVRPELPPATRAVLSRIMLALDLSPRVCLVLMLPVGLTLASAMDLSPIHGGWLLLVWVVALAWLALVLTVHRPERSPVAATLRRIDLALRVALVVALLAAAIASLAGGSPFRSDWLALKVAVYALAVACGVAIRIVLRPYGAALSRLLADGSSPEVEATLRRSLRGTLPFAFGIWACLVTAAALGILQP